MMADRPLQMSVAVCGDTPKALARSLFLRRRCCSRAVIFSWMRTIVLTLTVVAQMPVGKEGIAATGGVQTKPLGAKKSWLAVG